jgi:hypothetical protein
MAQAGQSLSPNLNALPLPPRYPGVAHALHHLARRAVERELRAQGLRVSHIPYSHISAQATEYVREHPELFDQAFERARLIAERQAGQRKRA